MNFDVSSLTAFVKNQKKQILAQAVLDADSIPYFQTWEGIKGSEYIDFINFNSNNTLNVVPYTVPYPLDTTSSGNTIQFSQRTISVVPVMSFTELDPETINSVWLSQWMKSGLNKTISFESFIVNEHAKLMNQKIESQIWSNNAATTSYPEGLIHKIASETSTTGATSASFNWYTAGYTAAQYLSGVTALYSGLPYEAQQLKLRLFVGHPEFNYFNLAMVTANYYHWDPTMKNAYEPTSVPGLSNVTITPVNGLNGTGYGVMTVSGDDKDFGGNGMKNIIFGCDLEGEKTNAHVAYIEHRGTLLYLLAYKWGLQYYYPHYISYSH